MLHGPTTPPRTAGSSGRQPVSGSAGARESPAYDPDPGVRAVSGRVGLAASSHVRGAKGCVHGCEA